MPDGQMIWSYLDNCQFSNSAVFENHLYLLRSHILILSRQSETICQTQLCLGSSSDERTGITYVFLFFLPFTITIFPTLYLYILLIRCLSRMISLQLQRHFDLPTRWLEVSVPNLSKHRYRMYNNTTIQNRLKICLCETRMKLMYFLWMLFLLAR